MKKCYRALTYGTVLASLVTDNPTLKRDEWQNQRPWTPLMGSGEQRVKCPILWQEQRPSLFAYPQPNTSSPCFCHLCLHSSWPGLHLLNCSLFFLYTLWITHIIAYLVYSLSGFISSSPTPTSLAQTLVTLNLEYYNDLLFYFSPNWFDTNWTYYNTILVPITRS